MKHTSPRYRENGKKFHLKRRSFRRVNHDYRGVHVRRFQVDLRNYCGFEIAEQGMPVMMNVNVSTLV